MKLLKPSEVLNEGHVALHSFKRKYVSLFNVLLSRRDIDLGSKKAHQELSLRACQVQVTQQQSPILNGYAIPKNVQARHPP